MTLTIKTLRGAEMILSRSSIGGTLLTIPSASPSMRKHSCPTLDGDTIVFLGGKAPLSAETASQVREYLASVEQAERAERAEIATAYEGSIAQHQDRMERRMSGRYSDC